MVVVIPLPSADCHHGIVGFQTWDVLPIGTEYVTKKKKEEKKKVVQTMNCLMALN